MDYLQMLPVGLVGKKHDLASAIMTYANDESRMLYFFAQRPTTRVEENVRAMKRNAISDHSEPARKKSDIAAHITEMIVQVFDFLPPQFCGKHDRLLEINKLIHTRSPPRAARLPCESRCRQVAGRRRYQRDHVQR